MTKLLEKEVQVLTKKLNNAEDTILKLKNNLEEAVNDSKECHQTIQVLENKIKDHEVTGKKSKKTWKIQLKL